MCQVCELNHLLDDWDYVRQHKNKYSTSKVYNSSKSALLFYHRTVFKIC